MNVERSPAPGSRSRSRANKSSVFWRVVARFMRLSTGSEMCCSGMSMYRHILSHEA